jgi:hypothetical protein
MIRFYLNKRKEKKDYLCLLQPIRGFYRNFSVYTGINAELQALFEILHCTFNVPQSKVTTWNEKENKHGT